MNKELIKQRFNTKLIKYLEKHKQYGHQLYFCSKNFRAYFVCEYCKTCVTCKLFEILQYPFRNKLEVSAENGHITNPLFPPQSDLDFLMKEFCMHEADVIEDKNGLFSINN